MQLLAISHAILNNSNIIVMDEGTFILYFLSNHKISLRANLSSHQFIATSAIDHDTESRIQQVLQNQFKNKTMIIIAHRLRTVVSCYLNPYI